MLCGARFVSCIETNEHRSFDESKLKALTGGDPIQARRMREDFWEFEPTHKLWLATNHRPVVKGTDEGIWRRLRLIPFSVVIPPEERDRSLPAKLNKELPGILNWAVAGCAHWQREGLKPPAAIQNAGESYRQSEDRLGAFLADCCIVADHAKAKASDLYAVYRRWTEENGERESSAKAFGDRLRELGFESRKGGHDNHRIWLGIGLLDCMRADASTSSALSWKGPPSQNNPEHALASARSDGENDQ